MKKDKNVIAILMLVIENWSNIFSIDRCQQITGCFFRPFDLVLTRFNTKKITFIKYNHKLFRHLVKKKLQTFTKIKLYNVKSYVRFKTFKEL